MPGTRHARQPFDLESLRVFNAYEPRQQLIDRERSTNAQNDTIPGEARVTVLSWEPRILLVDDFLSEREADEIVAIAGALDFRAMGVVQQDGTSALVDNTATSTIADLPQDHAAVRGLRARISQLSHLPLKWYEPLKGLNYTEGTYFRGHLDGHAQPHARTFSRVATAIVFLSDVDSGGETHFPLAVSASGVGDRVPATCAGFEGKDARVQSAAALAAYEDGSALDGAELLSEPAGALGVTVRPQRRRAVLWWNRDADGALALRSRHVGCPVVRGRKLVATQWMHSKPLPCDDDRSYGAALCGQWAAAGECAANPGFMRTSCAQSCGLCSEHTSEEAG